MSAPETTGVSSFHALRFGRAAARYEAQAGVQARMAEALLTLWGERAAPAGIVEFGCGTGLLTRRLRARFPDARLTATDAAPEMLDVARAALHASETAATTPISLSASPVMFRELDARGDRSSPELLQEPAPDLLAANAVVQWFPDLAAHFRFAARLAAPQSFYLVSGFGAGNFPELNALLAEPPFSYQRFPGHDPHDVETAAARAGWTTGGLLAWDEVEVLLSPRDVLQRLQDLGAVRDPREGGRMTRANLAYLLAEYERRFAAVQGEVRGVRLTWKPWAALLVR